MKENICNTYNRQRISTQDTYESIRKKQWMERWGEDMNWNLIKKKIQMPIRTWEGNAQSLGNQKM